MLEALGVFKIVKFVSSNQNSTITEDRRAFSSNSNATGNLNLSVTAKNEYSYFQDKNVSKMMFLVYAYGTHVADYQLSSSFQLIRERQLRFFGQVACADPK